MQFMPGGEQRYEQLVARAHEAVVALDFDGVLAPIVDEPAEARIHAAGPATLAALADRVRAIAVVTGRPARQAVALGDLDELGALLVERGHDLLVLGQYGNERWSARARRVLSPRPPRGLARFMAQLPDLLSGAGLSDAHIEEKGLAVAVHTRRLVDPGAAQRTLVEVLSQPAAAHGLTLEPGRMVVEVRAPGMDKGQAVRRLRDEFDAAALAFIGDDLGDVPAFEAVADMREDGLVGLLVCSASEEQPALARLADVVVDGPDGVMELLADLTARVTSRVTLG